MVDIGIEPRLDPPEPEILFFCAECGNEIYEGEEYWLLHGEIYCEQCIEDAKRFAEK